MVNTDLIFKCIVNGEKYADAKTFTMENVKQSPTAIPNFDTALPYLFIKDANKNCIFAGDILCLPITDKLMDKQHSGFPKSNMGKHLKENPDITEIYIMVKNPDNSSDVRSPFHYDLYFAHNHKIERITEDDTDDKDEIGKPKQFCCDESSLFVKYLIQYGLSVIDNIYATPDFLNDL